MPLLDSMLSDPYILRTPPKSTGRETFSDAWLQRVLTGCSLRDADVQATLCEFTARSIASSLPIAGEDPSRLLVCGGGAFNRTLMERLKMALPRTQVETTAACGIDPQHVEAAGFAWLAHRYLSDLPGNLPSVTGARHPGPLGALYRGAVGPVGAAARVN
jgi:anhydro-N-acetylmuramic acid kinase